jgi:hypothetical protein
MADTRFMVVLKDALDEDMARLGSGVSTPLASAEVKAITPYRPQVVRMAREPPALPCRGQMSVDVGIWVTVTLADGQIRGPKAALRGSPRSAETRPVQEEEAGGEGQN